ncbi:MAG: rRNA pseudouridine synthase [Oscillospiraceae bacterium]|jgi:16S rRNA pseudouridine516 synthase|nr:rRNA pseudouridine synthase [Oscillospiraceae bacterium]
MQERLDKFLSTQLNLSRKQARALIWAGKAQVNGELERHIDFKTDPQQDEILVQGNPVTYRQHLYLMMNKPEGVISASSDPKAKTVIDLLPEELRRKGLFPAGRLDKDTEGLLIITDDGQFAHSFIAPKKDVFKIYEALLDSPITAGDISALEAGITIDGGELCKPARLENHPQRGENWVLISISEGKYHQVKRMAEAIGKSVLKLKRISIGKLSLDPELKVGEVRELTPEEKHHVV